MITLTPAAAEHVQSYIEKEGNGRGLRITLKPSGCSGFAYELDIITLGEVCRSYIRFTRCIDRNRQG